MSGIEEQIAALPKLGRVGLQQRWREVFKTAPPSAFTPDLIARGIGYRLQEKTVGRLDPALARQLKSAEEGRGRFDRSFEQAIGW